MNAADVVLLQDRAFGPEETDEDLWMSTLTVPLTMKTVNRTMVLKSRAEVLHELRAVIDAVRADGVRALRTRILSHIQPTDELAIIASMRDRVSGSGGIIGSTSITWTLIKVGEEWKINQLFFDNPAYDISPTVERIQDDT